MPDRVLAAGSGGLIGCRWNGVEMAPRRTRRELGRGRLELAADWLEVDGPPLAFVGSTDVWATGGAVGGGPAGPQNDLVERPCPGHSPSVVATDPEWGAGTTSASPTLRSFRVARRPGSPSARAPARPL